MSIERSIVQKLYESKGLYEAEFSAGGSIYKCAFGRYYKDGEEITRDDYFNAKEQVGNNTPTPQQDPSGKPKVRHFVNDQGQDVFFITDPSGKTILTDKDGNPLEDKPEVPEKKPSDKQVQAKTAIDFRGELDDAMEKYKGNYGGNTVYTRSEMLKRILDTSDKYEDTPPSEEDLSKSAEEFVRKISEPDFPRANDDKVLDLYRELVAKPLALRGEYKFTTGREWGNPVFNSTNPDYSITSLRKKAGLRKVKYWRYR